MLGLDASAYCFVDTLPTELIAGIFAYLAPIELATVSRTCRAVYALATSDLVWQGRVQENVPGVVLTSPHPFASFRELYAAHDLRWFLPRYKLWFSGSRMTGKLVLIRYDPRTAIIEGYQVLATSRTTSHRWEADHNVTISTFRPRVSLHLARPELRLRPIRPATPGPSSGPAAEWRGRFAAETTMNADRWPDPVDFYSTFLLARPLLPNEGQRSWDHIPSSALDFPWPAPAVPATHRVMTVGDGLAYLPSSARPRTRAEVSDRAFHVQKWSLPYPVVPLGLNPRRPTITPRHDTDGDAEASAPASGSPGLAFATGSQETPSDGVVELGFGFPRFNVPGVPNPPPVTVDSIRAGPDRRFYQGIETYATLDPALYTPTPDKPWRGIWVGDYSDHGCEFLLIHQPDDDEPWDASALTREPGEDADDFARRARDARLYRGRLEAVKLTGDVNVPRGEPSFVVDDLGDEDLVTFAAEAPFAGVRVAKSRGHIARRGFHRSGCISPAGDRGRRVRSADVVAGEYIESRLLLISHDRLAQFWIKLGHINFFERVDIDRLLVP